MKKKHSGFIKAAGIKCFAKWSVLKLQTICRIFNEKWNVATVCWVYLCALSLPPSSRPTFHYRLVNISFGKPVRCECCQEVGWVEFLFPWPLTVMSFQGLLTQSSLDSCIHSFHAPPLHTAAHSSRPAHSSAPAYLEQWICKNVCVGNVSRDGILFFLSELQFLSVDSLKLVYCVQGPWFDPLTVVKSDMVCACTPNSQKAEAGAVRGSGHPQLRSEH